MPLYLNVDRIHLYSNSLKVLPYLFVRGASDITHDVGVDVSASSSSPHLSKLTHLSLNGIKDLECITSEGMGYLTSFRLVLIENCPNLASLLEEINNLMSLQHLVIKDCYYLASLPERIHSKFGVAPCYTKDAKKKKVRTGLRLLTSQTLKFIKVRFLTYFNSHMPNSV
ncbi:hypothetical protein DVH24_016159 [Malus domestica]|uniref:Uncharacterized protein n=1 Tax=Malus domestica TaxID=3750 RepID=A0A498JKC6_MALDO|nr:hypothetical protein DVH24_016159 [Malus domestica]